MKKLALSVLLVLPLTSCGGGLLPVAQASPTPPPPEQHSLRISAVGVEQFLQMPLTLANELGYYAAVGLTVGLVNVENGNDALVALGRGDVDVVSIPYEFTIRAQAQGSDVKMVLLMERSPLVLVVSRLHVGEVQSMRDLVGKPVGITAPATASEEFVKLLALRDGVDPSSIPLKSIGIGERNTNAIASGLVWAGQVVDPAATAMERDGTGKVLPESDTRLPAVAARLYGGLEPNMGLITTPDFIRRNPHTVLALTRAVLRALHYIARHSAADIADHMPSAYKQGRPELWAAALQQNLQTFIQDGKMPADAPARVLRNLQLVVPGLPVERLDLAATYDNSFVQRAEVIGD